jgi:phosphoglycolate phosphatase-like HAD superfamily hydrolase
MSYRLLDNQRQIYLREDVKELLRGIGKVIFDFDGVLAQTSQSYRQAIRKVVDYYFLELLGLKGEKGKLATLQDIQKFKNTGLYNNDWKLSYALISYYLNLILWKLEQENVIQKFNEQFCDIRFIDVESFINDLKKVGAFFSRFGISGTNLSILKDDNDVGLDLFLAQANVEKPKPTERSLVVVNPEVVDDKERLVKLLIPYDLEKPDLLKRLFEETYLGKKLYKQVYAQSPFFNFDASLIDIEDFIPTKATLELLRRKFGIFGIYSGRPRLQGMYILEKYGYIGYFNEKESVFLGDLLNSDEEMEKLGKPDPTLFIELIEKTIEDGTRVAYVGDGIADAILIEKAKKEGLENLSFLGVMSSSEDSNRLFTEYSKHGTDAILTDVNDIPYLFTHLGGNV